MYIHVHVVLKKVLTFTRIYSTFIPSGGIANIIAGFDAAVPGRNHNQTLFQAIYIFPHQDEIHVSIHFLTQHKLRQVAVDKNHKRHVGGITTSAKEPPPGGL